MMQRPQAVAVPPAQDLPPVLTAPASVAMRGNGFVFTMGYMALDPATGRLSPGSVEHETRLTLEGLRGVLEHAGSSLDKVVKAHVFLRDIERDFDGMNAVYREFFREPYPARRTVEAKLVQGLKVEIELIALA
jgi:2-iminobutanoate/2-iminopropanoate deaminase